MTTESAAVGDRGLRLLIVLDIIWWALACCAALSLAIGGVRFRGAARGGDRDACHEEAQR